MRCYADSEVSNAAGVPTIIIHESIACIVMGSKWHPRRRYTDPIWEYIGPNRASVKYY